MGTIIEMPRRDVVDLDRVAVLLDRMEWRLDEPCSVPGCSHDGDACGTAHANVVLVAA